MKIAISASGGTLDSPFEPRFGRVPGFVLYDSDSGEIRHVDNSGNMTLNQGAGIKTAQAIAQEGVEVLITGKVGPKALRALQQRNIQIVEGTGQTVRQVLANYGIGLSATTSAAGGFGQSGTAGQSGPGAPGGGRGMGGGGRGRGPGRGGQGRGGGARGQGPASGGRGMGGGGRRSGR